jgi:DNA-binding CsgD family transcriptional regulator
MKMASTQNYNVRLPAGRNRISYTQFSNRDTVASNLNRIEWIGANVEETPAHENLLREHKAQADLLETLIANAGFGVILASSNGQIIYANNVASTLIQLQRGLCSQQGRIKATDVKTNQKLRSLIFAASCSVNHTISDGSIILPTQDCEEKLAVHVVPISRKISERDISQGNLIRSPCVAALFIAHRTRDVAERANTFASLFGLTPGETRLFEAIVSDKCLTVAARRLKMRQSTARTHLKHIMAKTDTHRQAELIQLFLEMTPPYGSWRNSCPGTSKRR